jgi:RimJ/RimL family protein N-acetyltransferase
MDIQLRAVRESDLPIFFEQQRDPASNALAAVPARDEAAFYAHWRERVLADPTGRVRTIVVVDDAALDTVAGHLVCWQSGDARHMGYWIARPLWGRGIASAAVRLFLDEEKARPLHATVAAHNGASQRILEKSGFVRVGGSVEDDGVEIARYALAG